MDLHQIAESLVRNVIENNVASVGRGTTPVVLVGHSLGGIVIKNLLVMACKVKEQYPDRLHHKKATIEGFIANLCGVFYYATPHNGSKLADVLSKVPGNSPVLSYLRTLNTETARLNDDFSKLREKYTIPTYAIAESLPTSFNFLGLRFIVVKGASARYDVDQFSTAREDHISICKPRSKTNNTFQDLVQFVNDNVRSRGQVLTQGHHENLR
ncbi:unnamed protein product [Calypogeia fissa]